MHHSRPLRRGFTLVELLVVISIIAIIAGLVVPVLLRGRGHAWKVKCTNALKQIYPAATDYADKKYEFPRFKGSSEPRAHESLNLLVQSRYAKGLTPDFFKCPAGEASIAEADDEGKFTLTEDTLDYAWAVEKRRADKTGILSSDKFMGGWQEHSGHDDVVIALSTDGSVAEIDIDHPEWDGDLGLPKGLGR